MDQKRGEEATESSSHTSELVAETEPEAHKNPPQPVEKLAATSRLAAVLIERLRPIIDLGLGYLSLDRMTPTLSGGELQRLRLATQLTSELFGVVYVLDEPSAGLHPQDTRALLDVLD